MDRSFCRIALVTLLIGASAGRGMLCAQTLDTLHILIERSATWDGLQQGATYRCVADEYRTIEPYDINWGERFKPGAFVVSGTPGSAVLLTFALPDTLLGTAVGAVTLAYHDSSLGLVDSVRDSVLAFFDPRVPLEIQLDASGLARFWIAANPTTTPDATDMDTFIRDVLITATYADSASTGGMLQASAALMFAATVVGCDGCISIEPNHAVLQWRALRPGTSYDCSVDSLANIQPLDPENPERFTPCHLLVTGTTEVQVELTFHLPSTLRTPRGDVAATLVYDSAVVTTGGQDGRGTGTAKIDPAEPFRFFLNSRGVSELTLAANPQVVTSATEGDTLVAYGSVKVDYTGLAKGSRPALRSEYYYADIRFEAVVAHAPILSQNYPNPFNPSTTIEYWIQSPHHVRLAVYDLMGREVALLVDRDMDQGPHTASWRGDQVSGGIYFCRLTVGRSQTTRKLVLIR